MLSKAGFAVGGADILIESTVPLGSGLSSSAALEIALLRAFREAFSLPIDDVQMATLGQQAENQFVGAPVGMMDQMACTLAGDGEALFLDTRSLEWSVVPMPPVGRTGRAQLGRRAQPRQGRLPDAPGRVRERPRRCSA